MMILTKYLPATNTRGSRIKASFADNRQSSVTIGYPHEFSGAKAHAMAAYALVSKYGYPTINYQVESVNDGYAFISPSSYDNLTF